MSYARITGGKWLEKNLTIPNKINLSVYQTPFCRYDIGGTPMWNFEYFMGQLEEAGAKDLLLMDLETLVMNGIFQFINFPSEVEEAIMDFMKVGPTFETPTPTH